MPSQAISSQFLSIAEYEKCGRAFTYSVHLDEPCLLVGSDMKIISHEKRVQKTTSDGQDRQNLLGHQNDVRLFITHLDRDASWKRKARSSRGLPRPSLSCKTRYCMLY